METTETRNEYHWSLTLLGMALVIMFAYYGESVLAVLFFAVLLSFMLSPVVQALEYLHIPRAMAALISVVVLLAILYGITVASYNQAVIFAENVPNIWQRYDPLFSQSSAMLKDWKRRVRRSVNPRTRILCRCGKCRAGPKRSHTERAL